MSGGLRHQDEIWPVYAEFNSETYGYYNFSYFTSHSGDYVRPRGVYESMCAQRMRTQETCSTSIVTIRTYVAQLLDNFDIKI